MIIYKIRMSNESYHLEHYYTTLELASELLKITSDCTLSASEIEDLLCAQYSIYEKYPVVKLGKYKCKDFQDTECDITIQEVYVLSE
jgi:hypothetical protein